LIATDVSVPIRIATNAIEKNRVKQANLLLIKFIIILLLLLENGFKHVRNLFLPWFSFIGMDVRRSATLVPHGIFIKNIIKTSI